MKPVPEQVARFFGEKKIAVIGVSRRENQPGNAILKKLRGAGHVVFPVNPNTATVMGEKCYPDIGSLPDQAGAAVITTRADVSAKLAEQCVGAGVRHVWFHRSFGQGSVSQAAVRVCEKNGIHCLAGGCPMMYCEPVDIAHRCMRWFLGVSKRLPS